MQRARRLASIATVAAVGILVLTGCRSEPGVAAYIGDDKIIEDQVTQVVHDAQGRTADNPQARVPGRKDVASVLVLREVCQRFSADRGLTEQADITPDQAAQVTGAPADSRYAADFAALHTCLSGVRAGNPQAPTPAELADLVARGKAAGAIPPEIPDQEAAAQLDGDQLRQALASKRAITDAVDAYDVTVNPRYRPLEFPILTFQGDASAVSVPLGEAGSDAVTDRH